MDMELLDLLEDRVAALVNELETLRDAHKATLAQVASLTEVRASLDEENHALNEALAQEKQVKDTVAQRIDNMLLQLERIDAPEHAAAE